MKLHAYFAGLLADTVNLDSERLGLLDQRVGSIVAALKADEVLGPLYEEHIPQGSWPHRTIITPLPGDEFDADFLLRLTEKPEWTANPKEYLKQTRAAFRRSFAYKNMVTKKNRCCRIVYVNDCHVDVVPHLVLADGRQVIVDYANNQFEDTNPAGFTAWMQERDGWAKGHLRRSIRLLKYLRDYKNTFSVPSVILTTLLGERVQPLGGDTLYPDLPTAFVSLLRALDDWLTANPVTEHWLTGDKIMPELADPSCPGTTFNHRWTPEKYANFAKWISYYRANADAAYAEPGPDPTASLALWRDIFGPAFAKSTSEAAAAEQARVASGAPITKVTGGLVPAPDEEFIEDLYPVRLTHTVDVDATVRDRSGFRAGTRLRRTPTVKQMTVDFTATTDCPGPYELYWKVRNTGAEAAARGDLRGHIVRDQGGARRTEKTRYRGSHFVEAYVVRQGIVVARGHHDVTIS
ncbi:MAG: hypothetical protein M3Q22_11795 [Actinomycetota bacterium]|nr:hypothetical protein [Actinomycetota bacterium]